jgi:glycosyltransferase involved in cell wall biosynthesis
MGSKKRVLMMDIEWPGWGSGLMNRWAGNAASVICCNTRAEIDRYSRHFKIPKEKFRLVPMAFQRSDLREPRDQGFIFAGGNYGRDWETLLKAVEGLPYPVKIFTNITKVPHPPPNVTVESVLRDEYYNQMAGASCVVIPLVLEPLRVTGPTTWTNSMAMGKVVIVAEPNGAPDYMENGVSGFCVDYGDWESIRECIQKVMEDPALRDRIGKAARQRAEKEFSPEAFRATVLSLLEGA